MSSLYVGGCRFACFILIEQSELTVRAYCYYLVQSSRTYVASRLWFLSNIVITVFCTNLLDGATYAVPQGNPQRRSFKNIQVADLLRVLHDDVLVRRRVLLEM